MNFKNHSGSGLPRWMVILVGAHVACCAGILILSAGSATTIAALWAGVPAILVAGFAGLAAAAVLVIIWTRRPSKSEKNFIKNTA